MKEVDEVGTNGVISVNESNPLTLGSFEAGIAGGGKALIGLMNDADTLVLTSKHITKLTTEVGRAIIDENNIKIRIDLVADGGDAALKEFSDIVNWHDNGDQRKILPRSDAGGGHD